MKYAFIQANEDHHPVRRLCAVLAVHHSGYYAWRRNPHSQRSQDDRRVSTLVHQSWLESGRVYGYRKVCNESDRLVVMQKGRLVLEGASGALRDSAELAGYLGV